MASTKRTWLWVILGVMGTLMLLVVVLVGGAIYEFRKHVKNEIVATTIAEQEFTRQREKFTGQQPLIEFVGRDRGDDEPTIHHPPATARRVQIHTLRVLIYDLAEGHLIHADIPGWMLRAMPASRYGIFGAAESDFVGHRVTIEDLERHGLGLVLEGRNRDTRILIWSE